MKLINFNLFEISGNTYIPTFFIPFKREHMFSVDLIVYLHLRARHCEPFYLGPCMMDLITKYGYIFMGFDFKDHVDFPMILSIITRHIAG